MFLLSLQIACTTPETPVTQNSQSLPNTLLLRRMSLDIRGRLPSLAEYQEVMTDPNWEHTIDSLLESPEFEEHLVHRFAGLWYTRVDEFDIVADDFDLDPSEWWFPFARSVGEEPLRWMAYVAAHDRPWTDIVTSDTVLANDLLVQIFPMSYTEEPSPTHLSSTALSDWHLAKYEDGRPPVGILSSNGLWWRYPTDSFNMNRTRAAMITKMLLCDDYLARPINFRASTNILENTETAIQEDPSCLTCHASLDPLSASMFGFWWIERYNPLEATYYHPERELQGTEMMSVEPAWFGHPVTGFAEVGQRIAQDSRFHQCTVRQSMEMLLQRSMNEEDFQTMTENTLVFKTSFLYKELWKSILLSDEYRQVHDQDGMRNDRLLSPYQQTHTLATFTEYAWKSENTDLMDVFYRTMAGGIDGFQTFEAQRFANLSSSLVLERLAEASANSFVEAHIDVLPTPQDQEFVPYISELRLGLHGLEADQIWIGETMQLWLEVYDASGQNKAIAWEVTLSALFQDIAFIRY